MTVLPEGILYRKLTEDKVPQLVEEHLLKGRPVQDFMFHSPVDDELVPNLMDIDFFSKQTTVVLRNRGMIDAERIDDYLRG